MAERNVDRDAGPRRVGEVRREHEAERGAQVNSREQALEGV